MAEYPPPIENLPYFNNAVFTHITETQYLEYPIAQGAETLKQITVNGLSTFNNNFIVNDYPTTFNNYSGNLTFYNMPKVSVYNATPTSDQLITKYYADATYSSGSGLLTSNNVWQGTNTYLNYIPECSITATSTYQLTNLFSVQSLIAAIYSNPHTWLAVQTFSVLPVCTASYALALNTTLITKGYSDGIYGRLAISNTWTNSNAFNTICPSTNQAPTTTTHLTNKNYVDTAITLGINGIYTSNNIWVGNNTFNTVLPTSTIAPTTGTQFTNKDYVDGILGRNNAWTFKNSYDNYLPTSILTPLGSTDLTTKAYVDSASVNLLSTNNTWTGTNTFNTVLPTSTLTPLSTTDLTTKAYVDGAIINPSTLLSSNNTWTGTNTFNNTISTNTKIDMDTTNNNTIIGTNNSSLESNSVIVGENSGPNLDATSSNNAIIGYNSIPSTSGSYSVNVGCNNLTAFTGANNNNNVVLGSNAVQNITSGTNNTVLGTFSGGGIGSGSYNLCIGECMGNYVSALPPTNINNNVSIGANSMGLLNNNANNNIAIGAYALYGEAGNSNSGTISIGANSGVRQYGNYNTYIGYNAAGLSYGSTGSYNNCTAIGYNASAPTANNQIILGTSNETTLIDGELDLNGALKQTGIVSITTTPLSLTTSQSGYSIICNSGSSDVNLPDISGSNTGLIFNILNNSLTNKTINCSGAGVIIYPQNTVSMLLASNNSIQLKSSGTNWYLMSSLNPSQRLLNVTTTDYQLTIDMNGYTVYYSGAGTRIIRLPTYNTIAANIPVGMSIYIVNLSDLGGYTVLSIVSGTGVAPYNILFANANSSSTNYYWIGPGQGSNFIWNGTAWIGSIESNAVACSRNSRLQRNTFLGIGFFGNAIKYYPFAANQTEITATGFLNIPWYTSYCINSATSITLTLNSGGQSGEAPMISGLEILFRRTNATSNVTHNIVFTNSSTTGYNYIYAYGSSTAQGGVSGTNITVPLLLTSATASGNNYAVRLTLLRGVTGTSSLYWSLS